MDKAPKFIIYDGKINPNLGNIISAADNYPSKGVPKDQMRTLGKYAIVYLTRGQGYYIDQINGEFEVKLGTLLMIFPDQPHAFGPDQQGQWEEIHIIFEGPIFDLWYKNGILNPKEPLFHLDGIGYWTKRIKEVAFGSTDSNLTGALTRISKLQMLLTEILAYNERRKIGDANTRWLVEAKSLLGKNLSQKIDIHAIALELNMTYDGFRKAFARIEGISPSRYRSNRVIEQAALRLVTERLTIKEIAYEMGFSSEFHLSKRFKQITGMSPGQYRKCLTGSMSQDIG